MGLSVKMDTYTVSQSLCKKYLTVEFYNLQVRIIPQTERCRTVFSCEIICIINCSDKINVKILSKQ